MRQIEEQIVPAVERNSGAIFIVFSIVYFGYVFLVSGVKLLWDDEFFTLYISTAPTIREMWAALMTGADQHPPSFYVLTRAFLSVLGKGHVAVRLPAALGFYLMMVCLYRIVARRTSHVFGLAAALFPLCCGVLYYSTEARGYGLVLGFSALAFACWLRASGQKQRGWWLAGLWLSLFCAAASHYYAVLILVPIAAGELARIWKRRRIDGPMVLACSGCFVAILLFLPTISASKGYARHFWAAPRWPQPLNYFNQLFGPALFPLGAAILAIWLISRFDGKDITAPRDARFLKLPVHEVWALAAFSLIPFVCLLAAKLVTNGYHFRYAICAFPGIAVFVILGFYDFVSGSKRAGLILCVVLLAWSAYRLAVNVSGYQTRIAGLRASIQYLDDHTTKGLPIFVSQPSEFHRMSFYAPRSLARRLAFVADPERSVKYLGHDTIDRGLTALQPWFPLQIKMYPEIFLERAGFFVYGYLGSWNWLQPALTDDGFQCEFLGKLELRALLLARPPASSPAVPIEHGETAYTRLERVLTDDSKSLCGYWMNDAICRSAMIAGGRETP